MMWKRGTAPHIVISVNSIRNIKIVSVADTVKALNSFAYLMVNEQLSRKIRLSNVKK